MIYETNERPRMTRQEASFLISEIDKCFVNTRFIEKLYTDLETVTMERDKLKSEKQLEDIQQKLT